MLHQFLKIIIISLSNDQKNCELRDFRDRDHGHQQIRPNFQHHMQTGPAPAPLQQSTTTERTEVDQSVAAECAAVKKKGNQPAMVHNPKVVQVSKEVQYGHRGKINVNANDIEDDVHAIHLAGNYSFITVPELKEQSMP